MRTRYLTMIPPLLAIACGGGGGANAEENIGKVQQPIIAGTLVDAAGQKARGLVTIGGGCSGTLINQYWVLTADHCLTSNGGMGGPSAALGSLQVTAAWSGTVATPTRLVRNWGGSGRDVGLIFLGNGDFGSMPLQLLNYSGLDQGMTLVKFGRGTSAYAQAGPPAVAAVSDGRYRTANFTVGAVGAITYTLPASSAGQVGAGGDSGGPDWVTANNGSLFMNIAGVQSTCVASGYVAGMPRNWNWATGISSCNSAAIWDIYSELVEITRPQYVAFCQDYMTKAVAAAAENQSLGCGKGGARWTTDAAAHLDWCVGLTGNQAPPNSETAARTSALAECRRSMEVVVLQDEIRRLPPVLKDATPAGAGAGALEKLPTEVILRKPPPIGQPQPQSPAALIPAPNPAPGADFTGDWETATAGTQYKMTLSQDAAGRVSGEYQPVGSASRHQIVKGAVVGRELIAQWNEGSATGLASFALSGDGGSFSGAWASGATMPTQSNNPWTGSRVAALPPAPKPEPPAPQAGTCGPTGGMAMVVISDGSFNKLNVRDGPGGRVLTTIPGGTQVSIVGECGAAGAAGIVAGSGTGGASDWCQIDAPTHGCVSKQFLAFGASAGAAGIAKAPPQPTSPEPTSPAVQPEGGGAVQTARVKSGANLRAAAKAKVIGKLSAGAVVAIAACEASWCQIATADGRVGWVHQSLLELGGVAERKAPPIVPATSPQGPVAAGCGLPAGPATIVIPQPNLDKLNVRESPGGKVVTAISKGSQVSIIGECGTQHAAGIVAPSGNVGASGWCQIDAPVTGCVSAKYLVAGGSGAAGGAAGIAAAQPVVAAPAPSPSFVGAWSSSVDGVAHAITLNQNGGSVSGSYQGADGSVGQIAGEARGNVLRFSWSQVDGNAGSGKFVLSADGRSFQGSYSLGNDPDKVDGQWTGLRH
jgi:hypothetical protein